MTLASNNFSERPKGLSKRSLIVACLLILLLFAAFAFRYQRPRTLGKLVVLNQEVVGSELKVRLRYDRPDKHFIIGADLFGKDETGTVWKVPFTSVMSNRWDEAKQEFTLTAPSNSPPRWFVETEVFQPFQGMSKVILRAQLCLSSKSLNALREDIGPFYRTLGMVRSGYITNTLPAFPAAGFLRR